MFVHIESEGDAVGDIRSNFPEIAQAIKAIAQSWDFRGRGRHRSFGNDALDVVAERIYERTFLDQEDPDGGPLKPLKVDTINKKVRLGYPETIGVETGEMGNLREIQGERVIERRWCRMTYGTSEQTKIKEALFSEGVDPHQPARPNYAIDDVAEKRLDALFEEILDRNLKDLGA